MRASVVDTYRLPTEVGPDSSLASEPRPITIIYKINIAKKSNRIYVLETGKQCRGEVAKFLTEAEFVTVREARDKTLPMPKLILHVLQINVNGGRPPEPEAMQTLSEIPARRAQGRKLG
jgi:hypothetical protein